MTQPPEGLVLYLTDALPGQAKSLPYLFQGVTVAVLQAEAEAQDASLARSQSEEDVFYLLRQQVLGGDV
jgi:hypothetical protein